MEEMGSIEGAAGFTDKTENAIFLQFLKKLQNCRAFLLQFKSGAADNLTASL